MDDVADAMKKEEDSKGDLHTQVTGLQKELEKVQSELAVARASGNTGSGSAAGGVDGARVAELQALLEARSSELADANEK